MIRQRSTLAVLVLLAACQDGTLTAPPSGDVRAVPRQVAAIDAGPVTYFAPRIITREGTGVQTVNFPLQDREHSLFMEPFVLHVRADGDQRIVGIVRVDGVAILERRDLIALGNSADPLALEVAIGPTSVVTVELQGPTGGTLTFWIEAPLQPPPVITITSPVRHTEGGDVGVGQPGAFLQQGTLLPSPVAITGTACHVRFPITELEVAGVAVPVSGSNLCETFTVTQESRWGLSIINGRARNSRGRVGTVVQSYARSPEYYTLAKDAPPPRIDGLFTRLSQSVIDDGDRSTVNDIAALLERRLAVPIAFPPGTVIPCTRDVFQVDATGGAVFESVRVNSITVTGSQLAVDISVIRPSVDLVARYDFALFDGNCTGGQSASVTISASSVNLKATATITLTDHDTPVVDLSLSEFAVHVAGATATGPVVAEIIEALAALANSFIGKFIAQELRGVVASAIRQWVPDIGTPVTQDLSLNGAFLRFSGGMRSVFLSGSPPNGFVRLGAFARFDALTLDPFARASRGAIRSLCGTTLLPCPGGVPSVPPFSSGHAVGVAMHQDVLNHAFWSAWTAGAFNVADVGALPEVGTLTALSMSVRAALPPISMAMGDEPSMFEMAWGDLRVRATFDPVSIGAPPGEPIEVDSWVSGAMRGSLAIDPAAGRFSLNALSGEVNVQLITATLPFPDAAVRAAIERDVRAAITALARSAMGLVPVDVSIDGVGRIAATSVVRSNSYYLLGGSIE